MKKTYISIYATIALFIIVGTVVWFAYGIISDSDRGEIEAKNSFSYFAKSAHILSEEGSFTEKAYKDKLIQIAEEIEIKAFVITNLSHKVLISWPEESELIHLKRENSSYIEPDSFFTKVFTIEVNVKTFEGYNKPVVITAALSKLKPSNIFRLSRLAFLIVLTVVILTLLMILLQSVLNSGQKIYAEVLPKTKFNKMGKKESLKSSGNYNKSYSNPAVKFHPDTPADSEYEYKNEISRNETIDNVIDDNTYGDEGAYNNDYIKSSVDKSPDSYATIEYANISKAHKNNENKAYTLDDLENLNITKQYSDEAVYEDTGLKKEDANSMNVDTLEKKEKQCENSESSCVEETAESDFAYSPFTEVRLESSLDKILKTELKRAAAGEQDMTFMIVKLKDLTLESLVAKKIAGLLFDIIKSKDLIFEYEDDGFAAIFYDKNLDDVMKESENIYQNIQSILDEYDINEPIAIGITSRAERIIDSDRMLLEARAAIDRAIRSADEPIVAFSVNPEKYRQFISED